MEIILDKIGKKYTRSWIFRHVNLEFKQNKKYALLGSNGSGKSTLMQVISAYQSPTEGEIIYKNQNREIPPDDIFNSITFAAPYLDLPEELTLQEMLEFHAKFKKQLISTDEILERTGLRKDKDKEIKNFSSGMRQKLKLSMALFFDSELVLLDEPTTNLDAKASEWYLDAVKEFTGNRILIISSNEPREYGFCDETINIENYKNIKPAV